jgi:hypothetical protein
MIHSQIESISYSPLPFGTLDRSVFAVTVENTGTGDVWALRNMGRCYGRDGVWDDEPQPSSRTDEWLAKHRYGFEEAKAVAVRICGSVTWNGRTADELAATQTRTDESETK